jgi:hypothetical protein
MIQTGKRYRRGRLGMVDLLVKRGFVKKKNVVSMCQAIELNLIVQGGQLY